MPLSSPAEREHIHTRTVECNGYRRSDGLWDIEGRLVDVKSYTFHNNERGDVPPGEPVHEMWIRLTVDDDLKIHGVEATTEYSPFSVCKEIAPNFERLVGISIGPGWRKKVRDRVGGVEGCTHIVEMLGPTPHMWTPLSAACAVGPAASVRTNGSSILELRRTQSSFCWGAAGTTAPGESRTTMTGSIRP